jgi:hypothetical protein
LPWRTQIDIEPNYSLEGGNLRYDSTRIEIPHALADWGKIPFNPTIDGGWRFNNGEEDSFLVRLLLAEEFGKKWHFGANFGYERQVGGERESEYEINAALSYVAMDRKLSIGAEFLAEFENDDEDESSTEILLGPSILYKPTRDIHLAFVPLFGSNAWTRRSLNCFSLWGSIWNRSPGNGVARSRAWRHLRFVVHGRRVEGGVRLR